MMAMCIDIDHLSSRFTLGEMYEVSLNSRTQDGTTWDSIYCHVIDDDGNGVDVFRSRFKFLSEIREEKLDQILKSK